MSIINSLLQCKKNKKKQDTQTENTLNRAKFKNVLQKFQVGFERKFKVNASLSIIYRCIGEIENLKKISV
jgi:hypothetical protein